MDSSPGKKQEYFYLCSKQELFCLGEWSLVLFPKGVQFPLWKYRKDAFFCIFEGRGSCDLFWPIEYEQKDYVISWLKFKSRCAICHVYFFFLWQVCNRKSLVHPEFLSEDDVHRAAKLACDGHGEEMRHGLPLFWGATIRWLFDIAEQFTQMIWGIFYSILDT